MEQKASIFQVEHFTELGKVRDVTDLNNIGPWYYERQERQNDKMGQLCKAIGMSNMTMKRDGSKRGENGIAES